MEIKRNCVSDCLLHFIEILKKNEGTNLLRGVRHERHVTRPEGKKR